MQTHKLYLCFYCHKYCSETWLLIFLNFTVAFTFHKSLQTSRPMCISWNVIQTAPHSGLLVNNCILLRWDQRAIVVWHATVSYLIFCKQKRNVLVFVIIWKCTFWKRRKGENKAVIFFKCQFLLYRALKSVYVDLLYYIIDFNTFY